MMASNATGPIGRISKRIGRYVNHDDVLVRFVSLWLVVAGAFTAAWILSYHLLPQGLLRGGNPAATADYAGSVSREFLTLFGWNVAVSLIAVAANTFRSVNTPLGYVIQIVQAPGMGRSGERDRSPSGRANASRRRWPCSSNGAARRRSRRWSPSWSRRVA